MLYIHKSRKETVGMSTRRSRNHMNAKKKQNNYLISSSGMEAFEIARKLMVDDKDMKLQASSHHQRAEKMDSQNSSDWDGFWMRTSLDLLDDSIAGSTLRSSDIDDKQNALPISSLPLNSHEFTCRCCENDLCRKLINGYKTAISSKKRKQTSTIGLSGLTKGNHLCIPTNSNREIVSDPPVGKEKPYGLNKITNNSVCAESSGDAQEEEEEWNNEEKLVDITIAAKGILEVTPSLFSNGKVFYVDEMRHGIIFPIDKKSKLYNAFPNDWSLLRRSNGMWYVMDNCGKYYEDLSEAQYQLIMSSENEKGRYSSNKQLSDVKGIHDEVIMKKNYLKNKAISKKVRTNRGFDNIVLKNDLIFAKNRTKNVRNSTIDKTPNDDHLSPLTKMWEEEELFLGALPVWDDHYFTDIETFDTSYSFDCIEQKPLSERCSKRSRKSTTLLPVEVGRHSMIEPKYYSPKGKDHSDGVYQPFQIKIHPQLSFLVELHACLAKVEIIGVLGGRFKDGILFIQSALPCIAIASGGTDVEMDSVDLTRVLNILQKHELSFVGWYHSHPTFDPYPSSTDIRNQCEFQHLFRIVDSEIEPFVGLIVRPPSKKVAAVRDHTWFHVQQVSKNDNKYHRLISMGYNGIRLNENDENGVFCMRMHVSIRTRKDSFADFIFQSSQSTTGITEATIEQVPNDSTSDLSQILFRFQNRMEGFLTQLTVAKRSNDYSDEFIYCLCCSRIVVNTNDVNMSKFEIEEKLERHILNPRHAFRSVCQSSVVPSKVGHQKGLPDQRFSDERDSSLSVCICRHYVNQSLSVGRLEKCHANVSECGGYFHLSCCSGGVRLTSPSSIHINDVISLNKNHLLCPLCAEKLKRKDNTYMFENVGYETSSSFPSVLFEEKLDSKLAMKYPFSLSAGNASSEMKGMISQVKTLIKYYSRWGAGRRADVCKISQAGIQNSYGIDQCDRLRLTLSRYLAQIQRKEEISDNDYDEALLDSICKYTRLCWRWPRAVRD